MLEAARGLVRCGACLSIFEADQHFVDPLPGASNDENGDPSNESVFISAPEEYFDPAEFLSHGEPTEDDVLKDEEESELLYAKSDVHDSSFDVFDVDPAPEDSKAHEQILDSDFDVFDVSDIKLAEEQAKAEIQDNEFDIYDAGERPLAARPETRQESEAAKLKSTGKQSDTTAERFQLKASFSFAQGMPQATFVPKPAAEIAEPEYSEPAATVDSTDVELPESADESEKTLPPELADNSVVILPEGPDAATLLKTINRSDDSEVILPPGPDAATLLAELMESNDQLITDEDWDQPEQDEADAAYDEPAFLPGEESLDETGTADLEDQGFDNMVDDFSDVLAEGLEWEEAELEVDESSFVILPADPYQPSAFLELIEEQSEPSFDESDGIEEIDEQNELDEIEKLEEKENTAEQPTEESWSEPESAAEPEVPTLTDFVTDPEPSVVEDNEAEGDDAKDVIRSHIMATGLDEKDDSLEQLSEENLRAVRDVDTALELEQQKRIGSTRTGLFVGAGLVLVLISCLVFFWLRMPELSQDPRFRPWYQTACNLVGCSLPDYINPNQVETSNLVVRSHPQQDATLELTTVFRNTAQFPQPFPLLELTFSDLNNRPMMVFEFLPDEYLPQALRGMPLMPVGAPVQITLDLADPGPDAVNYQMTFKAAPPRPR